MDDMARSTAIPEITPAIAAAYGARMPRIHWCAVRWVYCHDIGMLEELRDELWCRASGLAEMEKWKDPDDTIEQLVDMVLVELAQAIWDMDGAKHYPIKIEADRARFMRYSPQKWNYWRRRYQAIYDIAADWVTSAKIHVHKAQQEKNGE